MLFNFQQIFKVLLHFVSEITEPLTMGAIVSELSKRARTFNGKMFIYAFQLIMTCWVGAGICILSRYPLWHNYWNEPHPYKNSKMINFIMAIETIEDSLMPKIFNPLFIKLRSCGIKH